MRREGVYTEYGHRIAFIAIADFCAILPEGELDYLKEVKALALRLYTGKCGPGTKYYLDKTPRYSLISCEIVKVFDEAHFIYQWRNPLPVVASIVETWGKGKWNLYEFEIEVFDGVQNLIESFRLGTVLASSLHLEDLVEGGAAIWKALFERFGLQFDESQLVKFSEVALLGRMGY